MTKLIFATALLSALAVQATPLELSKREILQALPQNADKIELQYQPYFDWDTDGCYQTAAIDPSGKLNGGLSMTGTPQGKCRDPVQLENSNTYSRRRCNNGICGIVYEYYYEKDQNGLGPGAIGHRHDFENVVVFVNVKENRVLRVAASQHSGYEARDKDFPLDGTHPLMVYHKDGRKLHFYHSKEILTVIANTHCNRFANADDIKRPENYQGHFFRAPLVGWLGWPNAGLRDKMNNNNWGAATPKTREASFAEALKKAGAANVGLNPNGPDDYLL
ncbi:hypothetical protein AMS68_002288 [Peltaster fructicola]|uniref:Uncharacterized protein n=1 Tax=Peltaster fructicola TaxID=286661 RepID=A0A6H0XQ45_9PEZI|nr:hypothetical protein AMS68_002288 [Peltaster fructicola]